MFKHPIPRQITTFEFKLIGFLTLKQFLYLVIFFPLGYIGYLLTPIPYLNLAVGIGLALIGVSLAFVKIQERNLEVWLINFIKSISSPTLYTYQKTNKPPEFLKDISLSQDEETLRKHLQSRQLLKSYLARDKQPTTYEKKGLISSLFFQKKPEPKKEIAEKEEKTQITNKPFLSGVVKSSKRIPLPGILVYIKDEGGNPLRLMKTNPHGVFATFKPLPAGTYYIEAMDPTGTNTFDKMKLQVQERIENPIEIIAKTL